MEQKQMTPAEALTFLDTACASVAMGRPAHVQGIQAVTILKQLIPSENGGGPAQEEDTTKKVDESKDAATK